MRAILASCLVLAAVAAQAASPLVIFGDSISAMPNVVVADADVWWNRLASYLGVTVTDAAANGQECADLSYLTYGTTPSASNEYLIMVGTNDAQWYGNDAGKRAASVAFLQDLVVYYAAPSKVTARNMTLTGSWINTTAEPLGIGSPNAGDSAVASVSGTAVYVSYLIFSGGVGGLSVSIDGVTVGGISPGGVISATQNGRAWSPAVARFGGLASGPHTVKLTQNTPGQWAYIDFVAGNAQASLPPVRVADVIRRSPAAYSNGNSDANVLAYGAAYTAMVAALAGDGLNVAMVPIESAVSPLDDIGLDGIHPLRSGHQKILDAFSNAM